MAHDEPTDVLYDFIYKDTRRIFSLNAQLFGGRVASAENLAATKTSIDTQVKASAAGFIGGERKSAGETSESIKETIDPHDLTVVDLLAELKQRGAFNEDVSGAPAGAFVLFCADVFFVDRATLASATKMMAAFSGSVEDESARVAIDFFSSVIELLRLPSMFLARTANGLVTGHLNEDGLSEPIASSYFKFGRRTLKDVYIAGIKDGSADPVEIQQSDNQIAHAIAGVADSLRTLLTVPCIASIIPVAMFTKHEIPTRQTPGS